jgi:outer membrane protein assembly factor BamB
MREMLSIALLAGGLVWCGHGLARADSKADERRLEAVNLKHDGESLLKFFRQRTLTDDERAKVKAVIVQLGDDSFKVREHALAELIGRGPVVVELLKGALKDADLEVTRRVERCLQRIKEKDVPPDVPAAAARLVAERKPAGAVEVLLAYLPFASNDDSVDQIRTTLAALAVRDGKTDKALAAALTDKLPVRRAAAADALCRANVADQKAAVRRLLQDPDPEVRLQVALALAQAGERDSIPVIIDLLPQLAQVPAWRAEDVLLRLAEDRNPPAVSLGNDEASRRKARDAWTSWWKANGAAVDLAKLRQTPPLLGYTQVVLLDSGRVMELGKNNEVRWQVDNLALPLDIQVLSDDRLLVAEYNARKVTERNRQGDVVWEEPVEEGPLVAQRLANGNTFIAAGSHVYEVTADHKVVFSQTFPGGERIMKAMKLPSGEIVCLAEESPRTVRLVRLDAQGKELSSVPITLGMHLFGGRIYMLPNGHALIPHNMENKVVEYDVNGKEVWKVTIDQPVAAVRLRNGDTLVTTMGQNRAVEFDRHGNEVWEYRTNTRVTRALRR